MSVRLNRRQALQGLSVLSLATAHGRLHAEDAGAGGVFAHGVASGDPDQHSVVLWTRVSVPVDGTPVSWEVSADSDFAKPVASGGSIAQASRDFTVKVVAEGLAPGASYYYRFRAAGATSPVGRTRTLPHGPVDRLGLAVASCSNYPFGHFNAYDAIARDDGVAFVLHLGDYIYEYGPDGYGGSVGAQLGREHQPAYEIVSLADYRRRHAQYKTDAGSRAMHARHPLIPTWDDHESTNNPWRGGAENHQPQLEGDWERRRAASLQAYYEWMPIREPAAGGDRASYWRHFAFGDLASLVTLETRHTGRSRQIEYADHLPRIRSAADADRFCREVLGAANRPMLSADMEVFLEQALGESVRAGRPWRLIGNQIPMARVHVPPLDGEFAAPAEDPSDPTSGHKQQLAALGRFGLPLYLDTWDGYPWARERFYDLCRRSGVSDLMVLTGDSHSFWINRLQDGEGRGMGVELGTTGITSPGDFEAFGVKKAGRMDELLAAHNDEVAWTDNLHRGYLRLTLTPQAASAAFVAVDRVDVPRYRTRVLRQADVARRNGALEVS